MCLQVEWEDQHGPSQAALLGEQVPLGSAHPADPGRFGSRVPILQPRFKRHQLPGRDLLVEEPQGSTTTNLF
jgi:hypothetical protein